MLRKIDLCTICRQLGWFVAALLAAVLLAGCASKPDATRYYLLTDPLDQSVVRGELRPLDQLAIGALQVPVYLQSRNIAVVLGTTEIRGARAHRWAEPLGEALQRYLQAALANGYVNDAPYLLDVTLHHLHGAESGTVLLDLDWRVRPRGAPEVIASGRFTDQLQQARPGYDALVVAHRQLLDRFADAAASVLAGADGALANQKHSAPSSETPAMMEKPSS